MRKIIISYNTSLLLLMQYSLLLLLLYSHKKKHIDKTFACSIFNVRKKKHNQVKLIITLFLSSYKEEETLVVVVVNYKTFFCYVCGLLWEARDPTFHACQKQSPKNEKCHTISNLRLLFFFIYRWNYIIKMYKIYDMNKQVLLYYVVGNPQISPTKD